MVYNVTVYVRVLLVAQKTFSSEGGFSEKQWGFVDKCTCQNAAGSSCRVHVEPQEKREQLGRL